jgi:hypothetical protein
LCIKANCKEGNAGTSECFTLVFGGLSSWFSISIGAGFGSAIVSSIAAIQNFIFNLGNSHCRHICKCIHNLSFVVNRVK